jgi:hypothetical protein
MKTTNEESFMIAFGHSIAAERPVVHRLKYVCLEVLPTRYLDASCNVPEAQFKAGGVARMDPDESIGQAYLNAAGQLGISGCEDDKADVKKLVRDHCSGKA